MKKIGMNEMNVNDSEMSVYEVKQRCLVNTGSSFGIF